MTIEEMGSFQTLSTHNEVYWHWHPADGLTAEDTRKKAMDTAIYLSSVNAISEDGEMVNIDGAGNRLASTLYGHEKGLLHRGHQQNRRKPPSGHRPRP